MADQSVELPKAVSLDVILGMLKERLGCCEVVPDMVVNENRWYILDKSNKIPHYTLVLLPPASPAYQVCLNMQGNSGQEQSLCTGFQIWSYDGTVNLEEACGKILQSLAK